METSPTPPDKTDEDTQKSANHDGLEHVSDLLIELWRDYKNSHLPNLIYSVAFVGGVLTLGNTSELFKRVSEDGRTLIIIAVLLALAAAGLSMMHRFTSQLFMEIETLPADRSMRNYFYRRNSTYKKITYSYGYSSGIIELFKFLHTLTKYLTSLFLYIGWVLFGLALILAFLRPADRPNDFCALANDQSKIRKCGEPTLSYFLEWFVGWLAKDFAFVAATPRIYKWKRSYGADSLAITHICIGKYRCCSVLILEKGTYIWICGLLQPSWCGNNYFFINCNWRTINLAFKS
jgi:hypothetical protein